MPRKRSATNKSNTIAFRVDPAMLAAIDEERMRLGVSRGELVRSLVAVHLETCPARLLERLNGLNDQIKRLSKNQVRALVTLLTRSGPVSLEEAKEIVRSNLIS